MKQLKKVQNAALCAIMGCHSATSVQHLHDECKMLKFSDHLNMQCSQFLLNTRQVTHPSHKVTGWPPEPRPNRKSTLQQHRNRDIEQYTDNGIELGLNYKKDVKKIHTSVVSSVLAKQEPNPVLGVPAPEVHHSDSILPRAICTTMRQLRSGDCNALQSYRHKLNSAIDISCPGCHTSPHTVIHLFSFSAAPTLLQPINMWARPRKVAEFVLSLPPLLSLWPLPFSAPRRSLPL
jgi:hypothetical protein